MGESMPSAAHDPIGAETDDVQAQVDRCVFYGHQHQGRSCAVAGHTYQTCCYFLHTITINMQESDAGWYLPARMSNIVV